MKAEAMLAALRGLVEETVREVLSAAVSQPRGPSDDGERLYRVEEAAERAAVSETMLRRWIAAGLLPATPVPGRTDGSTSIRIRRADLDALIQRFAADAAPPVPPAPTRGRPVRRASSAPRSLMEAVLERAGRSSASAQQRARASR